MNAKLRRSIIKRDGMICQYCGVAVFSGKKNQCGGSDCVIDHVEEPAIDKEWNLVVSCRSCNSKKNNKRGTGLLAEINEQLDNIAKLFILKSRIECILKRRP